jgi:hypothetical protein
VVTHNGHRCSFIKDAATINRVLLESSLQEARFQNDAIKEAEAEVSEVKSKSQTEYQQVHQAIGDLFDRVSSLPKVTEVIVIGLYSFLLVDDCSS